MDGVERSELLYRVDQIQRFFSQLWVRVALIRPAGRGGGSGAALAALRAPPQIWRPPPDRLPGQPLQRTPPETVRSPAEQKRPFWTACGSKVRMPPFFREKGEGEMEQQITLRPAQVELAGGGRRSTTGATGCFWRPSSRPGQRSFSRRSTSGPFWSRRSGPGRQKRIPLLPQPAGGAGADHRHHRPEQYRLGGVPLRLPGLQAGRGLSGPGDI